MTDRLRVTICFLVAFCMFVVAIFDLFSLGPGICATSADKMAFNCAGVRLLRSITGWPTNVAAAITDCFYVAIALLAARLNSREGFPEDLDTPAPSKGHAWWLVPLAAGCVAGLIVRFNGASYGDALGFGLFMVAFSGWSLRRYL
jgi:hypothetical protein